MKKDTIKVSEYFYSIQGEGKHIGTPALFIELKNCNTECKKCDCKNDEITIIEWLHSIEDFVPQLLNGAHLVFKGAETLVYQETILTAIEGFKLTHGFKPYIEVCTLGKIIPNKKLADEVDLFVCSLELSKKDINIDTLTSLYEYNTIFKLTIGSPDDYAEVKVILDQIKVAKKDIYLMPPGETFGAISRNSQALAELCKLE